MLQRSIFCVFLGAILVHTSIAQKPRNRETRQVDLTAAQIAEKVLPSVGLIICDDGLRSVQGSAFHIGAGVIVTNYHVISRCSRGIVQFQVQSKKRTFEIVRIFAHDEQADLAFLGVPEAAQTIPELDYAEQNVSLKIGETIYALGNPEGLTGTISQGIISSEIRSTLKTSRIQISAPISSGSSGGPVVNTKGKVIGVAVSSISEGQNLNFAVPVSLLRSLGQATNVNQFELTEDLNQPRARLPRGWKWSTVRTMTFADQVDCRQLVFDVDRGEVSGIPITAEIVEIGRRAKCYTAISAEGLYGGVVNFGGGIFFGNHSLYFYTKADVIEARYGFPGYFVPINPLGESRQFTELYYGTPDRVERRSNSIGKDATFLRYFKDYGQLTIEFVNDECLSVYISRGTWPR